MFAQALIVGMLLAPLVPAAPLESIVVADRLTPFEVEVFQPGDGPVLSFGTVQSQVVRTPDGTLDFLWRIQVDPQPPGNVGVGRFHLQSFLAGVMTPGWRTDGPGTDVPWSFSADAPGAASFVFIHQDPSCDPQSCRAGIGSTYDSRFFFLHTDATRYAATATFAVDVGDLHGERRFGVSAPLPTFAPAPIPEPASWLLVLTGALAVTAAARPRGGKPRRHDVEDLS